MPEDSPVRDLDVSAFSTHESLRTFIREYPNEHVRLRLVGGVKPAKSSNRMLVARPPLSGPSEPAWRYMNNPFPPGPVKIGRGQGLVAIAPAQKPRIQLEKKVEVRPEQFFFGHFGFTNFVERRVMDVFRDFDGAAIEYSPIELVSKCGDPIGGEWFAYDVVRSMNVVDLRTTEDAAVVIHKAGGRFLSGPIWAGVDTDIPKDIHMVRDPLLNRDEFWSIDLIRALAPLKLRGVCVHDYSNPHGSLRDTFNAAVKSHSAFEGDAT